MWKQGNTKVEVKLEEIGKSNAKISIRYEGKPCFIHFLKSQQAKKIAAYYSMMSDVLEAQNLMQKYKEIKDREVTDENKLLLNSLWRTAIIYYTRCFTDSGEGRRVNLNKLALFAESNNKYLTIHNHFIDIRHSYLAHAGKGQAKKSRFDVALVLNPDLSNKCILKTIFYVLNSQGFTEDEMNDFMGLLIFVRNRLNEKIDKMYEALKMNIITIIKEMISKMSDYLLYN